MAFDLLEQAFLYHPKNPRIPLEIGQIISTVWILRRCGSLVSQGKAAVPFYAARIYAELLRKTDRLAEAYAFLKVLYDELPDDNPFAQKPIILERISELEAELGLPPGTPFLP